MDDILEHEELTYIISHDLQEPIRMINSYVKLLEKKYSDKLDSEAKDYINYAVDGANKLRSMLDDLLSYSRLRKENVKRSAVKIPEVIETAATQLARKHSGCKYEIRYDPEEFTEIDADKNQTIQLFLNLIDNALKFNHDSDKVVYINMVKNDADQVFCVSDNGIGIDNQYHDKVFRIFQKLHSSSDYEGSGIGLALCKKIIENHDGNIWIESAQGNGTKIFFTFPKFN